MSSQNDLGSKGQRIGNPQRPLGLIQATAGIISLYIGIQLLLAVSALVQQGQNPAAWVALIFGIIIVAKSGYHVFSGLFKCFSLVVGRNDPKSLAHNCVNPKESQLNINYTGADLADMLNARQNKTFVEPRCWVESLYFTIFRRMFFLPPPYRNVIQGCLAAIIGTSFMLICYGILKFMISSALVTGDNVPLIVNLCVIIMSVKLVFIWRKAFVVDRNKIAPPDNISFKALIMSLAFAVLVPTVLVIIFSFIHIPQDGVFRDTVNNFNVVNWVRWFWLFALLPLALTVAIFFMAWCKSREYVLKTEVSERIVDWQESIHPRDLFAAIDNKVMAKRRYMEVPNRIYAKLEPKLQSNSSESKGEYSGYTIQETQPVCTPSDTSIFFIATKYVLAILAGVLTVYTYYKLSLFVTDFFTSWNGKFEIGYGYVVLDYALILLLMFLLCRMLWGVSNLFFSELKFESHVIYYKTNGTYSTSTLTVGASIYDSNRSENTVVRSTFHQWIIATKLVSTTFLGHALSKFDSSRFIMEMHEDPGSIELMLKDLKEYLNNFQVIAGVGSSAKNNDAADDIMKMNARAKAMGKVAIDNAQQVVVDDARAYSEDSNSDHYIGSEQDMVIKPSQVREEDSHYHN